MADRLPESVADALGWLLDAAEDEEACDVEVAQAEVKLRAAILAYGRSEYERGKKDAPQLPVHSHGPESGCDNLCIEEADDARKARHE